MKENILNIGHVGVVIIMEMDMNMDELYELLKVNKNYRNITINNEEIKQGEHVTNIIKKCQRILGLDTMDEGDSSDSKWKHKLK